MDTQRSTAFFKWCTIINGVMLVFAIIICVVMPDFIYGFHSAMFSLPREAFDVALYSFVDLYKILFLVFNAAPFAALLIIERK